jgi:hypothetical protein
MTLHLRPSSHMRKNSPNISISVHTYIQYTHIYILYVKCIYSIYCTYRGIHYTHTGTYTVYCPVHANVYTVHTPIQSVEYNLSVDSLLDEVHGTIYVEGIDMIDSLTLQACQIQHDLASLS